MFEIRLTVSAANAGWTAGDAELKQQIEKVGGRVEISDVFGRHAIGITCGLREKAQVVKLIKEFLGEIYCLDLKRKYLLDRLHLPMLQNLSKEILIRTLIVFDRERDAELVSESVRLESEFSIDGFYYFRLKELNERWSEIAKLTEDNVALLYDESALNLLLKFLLSAVAPKSETVRILEKNGRYIMKVSDAPLAGKSLSSGELMLELIDIAPMEIVFENKITDGKLLLRLSNIFDVKDANNTLSFGEIR